MECPAAIYNTTSIKGVLHAEQLNDYNIHIYILDRCMQYTQSMRLCYIYSATCIHVQFPCGILHLMHCHLI